MSDLIEQIENAAAGSVKDEVRLLKERRKTLDDVIKYTLGINDLQKSLESVLLLKKPAKDIPSDLLRILGNISDSVANLPSNELAKRLHLVEETIQGDINTIMGISNQLDILDATAPGDTDSQINTSKLHRLVTDFRRRSNTAIILKLHLRKRGVKVTESVIPVSPDVLVAQVSKLVKEEKKCRERTVESLTQLDQDIGDLIVNSDHPLEIKQYALMLHDQINQNIAHLKQGKDIEKMPFAVEIIQLSDAEQEAKPGKKKTKKPKPEKQEQKKEIKPEKTKPQKKSVFFQKLFKWISSPLSVHWRDL